MKTILLTIAALGFTVSPALATECPLLHKQVMAAEGDTLHKAGKHAEAAKALGITLTHKPK